jgi:putative ABC transport system permease protein
VRRVFRLAIRRREWTEADVDAELRLHVELRVDQLVAHGWSRTDAEAEARRRFGPSWDDAVHHLHRSGHAREERLAMRERLDSLWHDVRYTLRTLRRAPRFAVTAVLTLALGLGTTTVIYSLVDHVVLRPMAYAHPDRLVVVREMAAWAAGHHDNVPANASHFLEWTRSCSVCEGLAAIKSSRVTLVTNGDPQRLGAARVSTNLFPLLGVQPALGRGFAPEEEQLGRDGVVVLSDAFWHRQFGGDPSIVGRTILLNAKPVEVVGIMPPGFTLPSGNALGDLIGLPAPLDIYRPLALTEHERTTTGQYDYAVIARLRAGATVEQARAELDAIERRVAQREGEDSTITAAVIPLQQQVVGGAGRPLLLLLGAVGAVLLIVCVNLANLSLARHVTRQHESAIRVALGAGRRRIARLALVESLVIALGGGALGLLFAQWGLRALIAIAPASLPRVSEVQLDARVFGAALLLTIVVGILVGAIPAVREACTDPGEALKSGSRAATTGRHSARRRATFIAVQVAFTTVLLVAAGLFLTSFIRVLRVDRGFVTDRVLAADVAIPSTTYATPARVLQFYDRAAAEASAIPGVDGVAIASALPLEGETWINGISRPDAPEHHLSANYRFVSPSYFSVVGTPVRRGHAFTDADRGRRLVVVSQHVARSLWPDESPIGQRLTIGWQQVAEVVGVVADVHTTSLEQEGSSLIYLPTWENPQWQAVVIVRTAGDPAAVATALRTALRRADPTVPVPKIRTMQQVVSSTVAARRFQLVLFGLFAFMALVTASIGIYGVISQSLAGRTREIGVRMALGAQPGDVHRLVLREGLTPVALGLIIGITGALLGGRIIASLLFEVRPGDPLTLLAVCILLGLVAVLACTIPARRATTMELATMLHPD